MIMLSLSLIVNALIVFPVSIGMLAGRPGIEPVFGAATDARQILASVYLAIGIVSLAALSGIALGHGPMIAPMAAGLLLMQIVYKTITVATVGLTSSVVLANVVVTIVHVVTLVALSRV